MIQQNHLLGGGRTRGRETLQYLDKRRGVARDNERCLIPVPIEHNAATRAVAIDAHIMITDDFIAKCDSRRRSAWRLQ